MSEVYILQHGALLYKRKLENTDEDIENGRWLVTENVFDACPFRSVEAAKDIQKIIGGKIIRLNIKGQPVTETD